MSAAHTSDRTGPLAAQVASEVAKSGGITPWVLFGSYGREAIGDQCGNPGKPIFKRGLGRIVGVAMRPIPT